jgi:hypothetical protein
MIGGNHKEGILVVISSTGSSCSRRYQPERCSDVSTESQTGGINYTEEKSLWLPASLPIESAKRHNIGQPSLYPRHPSAGRIDDM